MTLVPPGIVLCAALLLTSAVSHAWPAQLSDLYAADAIVTGRGEKTRQPGFEDCLRQVVVRVSGDPRLATRPGLVRLLPLAGDFVTAFRYRDRLSGMPVHDDQGTYDRPHDLHCSFDRAKIDVLLAELGSRPWLAPRPRLTIVLAVENPTRDFTLASDGSEAPLMNESLLAEAASLGLEIVIPARAALAGAGLEGAVEADGMAAAAEGIAAGGQALAGRLAWNGAKLVWEADWRLPRQGMAVGWKARSETFDAAFREGLGGAAQVLSGNGQPQ